MGGAESLKKCWVLGKCPPRAEGSQSVKHMPHKTQDPREEDPREEQEMGHRQV